MFRYYEIHTLRIGERKGITKHENIFFKLPIIGRGPESVCMRRLCISIPYMRPVSYAHTFSHTHRNEEKKKHVQCFIFFPPNKFGARRMHTQRNYVHIICIKSHAQTIHEVNKFPKNKQQQHHCIYNRRQQAEPADATERERENQKEKGNIRMKRRSNACACECISMRADTQQNNNNNRERKKTQGRKISRQKAAPREYGNIASTFD